ncbi:MAG: hypothetical protein DRP11_02005 [Candidatus Aenigmatarchaeota archaeon]|nr:MAG: hypothetical protein DRP11_02005 [Candidatus Aenigmarchaeota archaeon]
MSGNKKNEEKGIISFSEFYKGVLGSQGSLSELVNQEFIIREVEFKITEQYGETALVTIEIDGHKAKYHTFSGVLLKQLKEIKKKLDEGYKGVKVTLKKVKRYYTFV